MLAYLLILAGFALRLLPLDHNAAPIISIAVFSGAYLDRRIAPWVPLAVMVLTDAIIGFHDIIPFTWGGFLIVGIAGTLLKGRTGPLGVFFMTLGGVLMFFVISNFGVWLFWYPPTFQGLLNCYAMALPFLRNMIAGNLIFSAILFSVYGFFVRSFGESRYSNFLLAR